MSLAISLVVLQEVTDVLIHLGAHSGVGTWHLQCLAHWGGLAEQDYNPSGPMLCLTRLCETQLKSAWPSYLVDDQAFYCFFNAMLSYRRPCVAQLSASPLHSQPGLLMELYPAGGTWEVRDAVESLRSLSPTRSPSSNVPVENILPFVACLCSLCKEPHALRYQKVRRLGGGGWREEKKEGGGFFSGFI